MTPGSDTSSDDTWLTLSHLRAHIVANHPRHNRRAAGAGAGVFDGHISSGLIMSADALAKLDALVQAEKLERQQREAETVRQEAVFAQENKARMLYAVLRSQGAIDGEDRVLIPVPAGLCGRLFAGGRCKGMLAARGTSLGVIVCHPWGPLGGSMHDMHILTIVQAFQAVTTLRFNFRTGLDCGYGACADLRAACDYLLHAIDDPPERLLLVGYSYGSLVVAETAPDIEACSAFAMLAPPLGVMKPLFGARRPDVAAARSRKPKLALLGTHDQFCTKERFNEWASTLAQPAAADIVYGREVVHSSCCGDQKCDSNHRRQLVHHFNVRVRPRRASRATTCVPRTLCS